ncbi:unnamed protein product [Rhodiola kirilowii]
MSREGSQTGDNVNNNEIALVNENKVIPPFYDDPEQLVRARNRAVRQAQQLNQRAPVAQNGAGARQQPPPPRPPHPPIHVETEYEEEYYYEPTMRDLSAPNFQNIPWCIHEGPDMQEIVSFHGICQTLRPYEATVENFKLKAFHFSLTDAAHAWFLSLPSGSIRTWDQMQKKFLDKYYPTAKAG